MHIGKDTRIDAHVRLPQDTLYEDEYQSNYMIGDHSSIDFGFYCTSCLSVGDYVHIGPHCSVIGGIVSSLTMKHFSFLAAGCRVICATDEHLGEGIGIPWVPRGYRDKVINKPVVVESFAGVCTNAVILPGVTVREGSIIGAGCIVREDTSPWQIYIPGTGNSPIAVKLRPKEKIVNYAKELGYDISS
jgi:acetyltransferase-like isoleucine patch superfamily enzyme